jgi:hypothetical protein
MKFVFFDVDSETLLSRDGRVRPFMLDVLAYCYVSKIRVFLSGSPENVQSVMYWLQEKEHCKHYVMGSFSKDGEIPHYPNLVISCNNEWLSKFPGLLIPPYDPDRTNKFIEISFAGRLLDAIKDRVVLDKQAPEKKPQSKPKEPEEETREDSSNWGFAL